MDQRTGSLKENEGLSLCLIINNMEFKLCLKARNGAEEDNSKLKECFMKLGFHVVIKMNQTCEEMKKVLKENSKQDHSKRTCFVCVLMSHGDNGNIFATDGEIDIQELISEFYEDCHPSLKEKPKLFFIQACRGEYFDTGKEAKLMGKTPLSQLEPAFLFNKERVYPGFLLAYATPQGFVAHRSKRRGSHFIQQMCKQFMKEFDSATGQDILHQLTHVHRDISNTDFGGHFDCSTCSNIRMKQIPSFFSTLNENFLWKKVDQKAVAETPYVITQHKRCVIINIVGTFPINSDDEVSDVERWKEYFEGFEIREKTVTSFDEAKHFLIELVEEDLKKEERPSCLACVLLCQIEGEEIRFARNGNKDFKYLANLFRGDKCGYLNEKPKLFFIQERKPVDGRTCKIYAQGRMLREEEKLTPIEADFIYFHGFPPADGSQHSLIEALTQQDKNLEFTQMLTKTLGTMRNDKKQGGYIISTFTKELYLWKD